MAITSSPPLNKSILLLPSWFLSIDLSLYLSLYPRPGKQLLLVVVDGLLWFIERRPLGQLSFCLAAGDAILTSTSPQLTPPPKTTLVWVWQRSAAAAPLPPPVCFCSLLNVSNAPRGQLTQLADQLTGWLVSWLAGLTSRSSSPSSFSIHLWVHFLT